MRTTKPKLFRKSEKERARAKMLQMPILRAQNTRAFRSQDWPAPNKTMQVGLKTIMAPSHPTYYRRIRLISEKAKVASTVTRVKSLSLPLVKITTLEAKRLEQSTMFLNKVVSKLPTQCKCSVQPANPKVWSSMEQWRQ